MKKFAIPATALMLLASGSVFAQNQEETQINVSAEVAAACGTISATPVDFGTTDTDATSTITVNCSSGTPYDIEIDYGMTPQGTGAASQRTVTGSGVGAAMDYDVSQNVGGSLPWGLKVDGLHKEGTGTGADEDHIAYFVLDRGQASTVDTYEDLLTVYLNF